MTQAAGCSVNLGQISLSIHTGTHVDAPYHYDSRGVTVEHLPIETLMGPAWVADVRGRDIIRRADLGAFELERTPRVLLRTDAWLDRGRFPASIPVMDPALINWSHQAGVLLVGVDVPSVDSIDSKDLPNHHALGKCGIVIVESLDLSEVPVGAYELVVLPLRLVGADGSPVRAILMQDGADRLVSPSR
jgi:arylformamidase